MRKAQQLYRIVNVAVKGCFEFKKPNQRDCDCFMSANILDYVTMAQGTLTTLSCRIENGCAVCDIIPEDWKEGDVLRFVSVEGEKVNTIDKTIDFPLSSTMFQEVVNDGMYCWIHILQGREYTHVSTLKQCKTPFQLYRRATVTPPLHYSNPIPKSVILHTKVGVTLPKCPK